MPRDVILGAPPSGSGVISLIQSRQSDSLAAPVLKPGPRNQNSLFNLLIGSRRCVIVMMRGDINTAANWAPGEDVSERLRMQALFRDWYSIASTERF